MIVQSNPSGTFTVHVVDKEEIHKLVADYSRTLCTAEYEIVDVDEDLLCVCARSTTWNAIKKVAHRLRYFRLNSGAKQAEAYVGTTVDVSGGSSTGYRIVAPAEFVTYMNDQDYFGTLDDLVNATRELKLKLVREDMFVINRCGDVRDKVIY
jgi:hypothetical protein